MWGQDYGRINDALCFQNHPLLSSSLRSLGQRIDAWEKFTYDHEFDYHVKSGNADRLPFDGSIFRFDRSKNAYWTPPLGSFLPMDVRFCVLGYSSQYRQFCEFRILISQGARHDYVGESVDVRSAADFFLETDEGIHGIRHFGFIFSRCIIGFSKCSWILNRGDDVTAKDQRDRPRNPSSHSGLDRNRPN